MKIKEITEKVFYKVECRYGNNSRCRFSDVELDRKCEELKTTFSRYFNSYLAKYDTIVDIWVHFHDVTIIYMSLYRWADDLACEWLNIGGLTDKQIDKLNDLRKWLSRDAGNFMNDYIIEKFVGA